MGFFDSFKKALSPTSETSEDNESSNPQHIEPQAIMSDGTLFPLYMVDRRIGKIKPEYLEQTLRGKKFYRLSCRFNQRTNNYYIAIIEVDPYNKDVQISLGDWNATYDSLIAILEYFLGTTNPPGTSTICVSQHGFGSFHYTPPDIIPQKLSAERELFIQERISTEIKDESEQCFRVFYFSDKKKIVIAEVDINRKDTMVNTSVWDVTHDCLEACLCRCKHIFSPSDVTHIYFHELGSLFYTHETLKPDTQYPHVETVPGNWL